MALCKVIKQTAGWNVGDHVEAFDVRLKELVDQGIVEVLEADVPSKEVTVEAPKKRGRKKGV